MILLENALGATNGEWKKVDNGGSFMIAAGLTGLTVTNLAIEMRTIGDTPVLIKPSADLSFATAADVEAKLVFIPAGIEIRATTGGGNILYLELIPADSGDKNVSRQGRNF